MSTPASPLPAAALPPGIRAAAGLVALSPLAALVVWGADRRRILNQACLRLGIGNSLDDQDGAAWRILQAAAGDAIDAALRGEARSGPERQLLPARAGLPAGLWCQLHCWPVTEGAAGPPAAALCVLVDVSAEVVRRQQLERLADDAQRRAAGFALVYHNMEEVAFHLVPESQGRLRFASVNAAFCATTGLAQQDIVGKLVEEVIPQPAAALMLPHFDQAIAGACTQRWEESAGFPSGCKVGSISVTPLFDAGGTCTALIGSVHDITELKRVEGQLRTANAELAQLATDLRMSEERLGFALESGREGVWDWDLARETVFYSQRWKDILGLRASDTPDAAGLWWNRMHPDDVGPVRQQLRTCLNESDEVCVNVHRLWHEAGHWIWVEARGSVVRREPDGTATRMVGTIVDISATTELRQELERSYALLANLAQQVPGALFQLVMRADGHLSFPFISAMSDELFGCAPAAIEADLECLLRKLPRRDRARLRRSMRASASRLQPWRAEYRVRLADGKLYWRELSAKPARLRDGSVVWHGFTSDISDRKRTEETIRQFNEKLERRAHYDTLTGLPNRILFRDRLEQEMKHATTGGHSMALLFIDLDRFKEVNDLLGHDAGDALLAHAARRIAGCLRPGDTVARLGGDEFTVILTETREVAHVEQTAQQIVDVLRAPFRIGIEQVNISASIGITLYPGDGELPEELMRNADHAMYRAKSAGRNQLAFFEPAMQVAAMRRLKLTHELRRALGANQFQLHFQPILDNRSGVIDKAEALLRWRRPGAELALPSDFIAIAEETGLIHEIGNWVFFQAVDWAKRWSEMLGRRFQISVNKSPVQFQFPSHSAASWIEYLDRQGLAHDSIAVEITEGVLLHLTDAVISKLHALHAGGVEVSIDDFGTGYSSMSYLKRLEIDYLKIDRSFVAEMLHDRSSQTITETIIVMAHKLGLKVIAEGVETAPQRAWLLQHECDYVQGFLFGQPLPWDDFERLLVEQPFVAAGAPARQGPPGPA
jgi:diguanylate cyclase (GGDEF)-like protein/PAS domain S-box-containing protein